VAGAWWHMPLIPALEAGGFLSSRPAWSTEWVPGQPGIHREILSQKKKKKRIQQGFSQSYLPSGCSVWNSCSSSEVNYSNKLTLLEWAVRLMLKGVFIAKNYSLVSPLLNYVVREWLLSGGKKINSWIPWLFWL
jgi:hypothetical protein